MGDNDVIVGGHLEEFRQLPNRIAGVVHVSQRSGQNEFGVIQSSFANHGFIFKLFEGDIELIGERIQHHESEIMPGFTVFYAGIA